MSRASYSQLRAVFFRAILCLPINKLSCETVLKLRSRQILISFTIILKRYKKDTSFDTRARDTEARGRKALALDML